MNGLEMEGRGVYTWKLENLWEPLDVNVIFFKFQAFFFLMFHGNFMKQMHTIHIGISSMNIFWVGWRKWLKGTWLNHIGHLFFRSHIHLRNNFCCTTCGTGGELIDLDWGGVERCQMLVVNLYQQISLISTLVLFRQHSWKYRETSNKSFHPKNRSSWATLEGNALLGWAAWWSWGGWGWQDGLRTGTWRLNRCVQ